MTLAVKAIVSHLVAASARQRFRRVAWRLWLCDTGNAASEFNIFRGHNCPVRDSQCYNDKRDWCDAFDATFDWMTLHVW